MFTSRNILGLTEPVDAQPVDAKKKGPVSTTHPYYPPMPGTMTADHSLMACRSLINSWQMEMWDTFSTPSVLPTQNGAHGQPSFMHVPYSSELPHGSTSVSLITPCPPPSATADTFDLIDFFVKLVMEEQPPSTTHDCIVAHARQ